MSIHKLFAFLLLFLPITVVAQTYELPEHKREALQEIVRDPVLYELNMRAIETSLSYYNGEISRAECVDIRMRLFEQMRERREALQTGGDRLITGTNLYQASETTIAVNPNDGNNTVASTMDVAGTLPIYYTTDGGNTWLQSAFNAQTYVESNVPNAVMYAGGGDPVLTCDSDGIFYFAQISNYQDSVDFYWGITYVYSVDGGATWLAPSASDINVHTANFLTTAEFLDREWIGADQSQGATGGTVYVNGSMVGGTVQHQIMFVKPTGSFHFTQMATPSLTGTAQEHIQLSNVEVDRTGVVHTSGVRYDITTLACDVLYARSTDQGQTWSTPTVLGTTPLFTLPQWHAFDVFQGENPAVSLGVDNTNNDIYVAWTDFTDTTADVVYCYSNDAGLTWSAPIDIGKAVYSGSSYHQMINIAPDDGNCSAAWYVIDSATHVGEYVVAEIINGGSNISSYEFVQNSQTDYSTTPDFFGHYNVNDRKGCDTYIIWADGSSGSGFAETYVAKVDACNLSILSVSPLVGDLGILNLYPNPSANSFQVELNFPKGEEVTVDMFDAQGKHLDRIGKYSLTRQFEYNIEDLPAGTYLIRLTTQDGRYATKQFVKQ